MIIGTSDVNTERSATAIIKSAATTITTIQAAVVTIAATIENTIVDMNDATTMDTALRHAQSTDTLATMIADKIATSIKTTTIARKSISN